MTGVESEPNATLADPVARTPARLSAAAAVGLLVVAVHLVAPAEAGVPLGTAVLGVLLVGVGRECYRRERRLVAGGFLAAGIATGVAAVATGVETAAASELLRLLPGVVGVFAVGAALVPIRRGWSRGLLKVGTALVLVSVLVCGVLRQADQMTLAASTAATVVTWDVGENAVSIGEQLGRQAETTAIQTTHALGSGLVGVTAVFASDVAEGVGSGGLSLPSLALMLLAMLLFSAALFD